MRHVLIVYRALRPVQLFGRILGTGERIKLPEADGEKLVEQGYLVRVVNGAWGELLTR